MRIGSSLIQAPGFFLMARCFGTSRTCGLCWLAKRILPGCKFQFPEDGTLEGDVRFEYNGQSAVIYRMENYDKSDNKREEDLREDMKRRFSTAEVSNLKIA